MIVDVCVQQQSFQVVCLIETLKQNLLSRCLLLFMVLREAEVVRLLILLLQIQLLPMLPLAEMEEAEEVLLLWLLP